MTYICVSRKERQHSRDTTHIVVWKSRFCQKFWSWYTMCCVICTTYICAICDIYCLYICDMYHMTYICVSRKSETDFIRRNNLSCFLLRLSLCCLFVAVVLFVWDGCCLFHWLGVSLEGTIYPGKTSDFAALSVCWQDIFMTINNDDDWIKYK